MWRLTLKESVTTSWPKTRAQPSSGSTSVARTRTSVDLPLPLGPITPVVLPRTSVRSRGCSATRSERRRRRAAALASPRGRCPFLVYIYFLRLKEEEKGKLQQDQEKINKQYDKTF